MKKNQISIFILLITLLIGGCTGIPKDIEPVSDFELKPYLGKWYEIARLDHSFERDLTQVTAQYSLREDGGIKVINRGWSEKKQQWQSAQGKAYRVSKDDLAHLKVSFFGPFYGSYIVFELGENYEYAFVSGNTKKYLWLLAREPQVSAALIERFKQQAVQKGFDLDNLVFP